MKAPLALLAIALLAAPATPAAAAPSCVVTVEQQAEVITVARRVRATPAQLEARLGEAILGLMVFAGETNLTVTGAPLARYHKRGKQLVVDAALPIATAPKALRAGLKVMTLPAGPAAIATHVGRLQDLPAASACVRAWAKAARRRTAGAGWEVYETNPFSEPDPTKQRARIVLPLAAP